MNIEKVFDIKELAQEFMHAPIVKESGHDCILMFDYESDNGQYKWTNITFKNTIDYKHTNDNEVNEMMVKAYNSVVEVLDSEWINKFKSESGISKTVIHYLIYFDGYGAYEFLSSEAIYAIKE